MASDEILIFHSNVIDYAPPLARASVVTGVEVHITGGDRLGS